MLRNLLALGLLGVMACAVPAGEETDEGSAAQTASRHFTFVVHTKGFIAPITDVGAFDNMFLNPGLHAFAVATNHHFNENPQDGLRTTGQYRLWAQVKLDVTCTGSKVQMKLTDPDTDAGWEGPVQAVTDPLLTKSTPGGKFWFQAAGRPAPIAEPAFQAVAARDSSTIWYEVEGSVICSESGDASLKMHPVTTAFPSFRLWTEKHTGNGTPREVLVIDRPKGPFVELWKLPRPPAPPTSL